MIPLFAIGMMMDANSTFAWNILGAQGRYRLATVVVAIVSWCFTIPLAALFSIAWSMNLQGQLSAVVLGFMLLGVIQTYLLFRSDWVALSSNIIKAHEKDNEFVVAPEKEETQAANDNTSKRTTNSSSISSSSTTTPIGTPERISVASPHLSIATTSSQQQRPQSPTVVTDPTLRREVSASLSSREQAQSIDQRDASYSIGTRHSSILASRDHSELGSLSRSEATRMRAELTRILNALTAACEYGLLESKDRILSELRWLLYTWPDIFGMRDIAQVLAFMEVDDQCREELFSVLKKYLPPPLHHIDQETLFTNQLLSPEMIKEQINQRVQSALNDSHIEEGHVVAQSGQNCGLGVFSSMQDSICFVLRE